MSSFRTLGTSVSALNAAQANLYVTGHNMSNVNTPGYVRQQVIQEDSYYNNVGQNHSGALQIGLGVNVAAIRQIRNKFLDMAYRSSSSTLGFYNVAYNAGLEVQSVIGELEGEYKLQSVLRDLRSSLSELSNDPKGVDTRGEFVSTCVIFADKANDTYKNLRDEQYKLNNDVIKMTGRINELVDSINTYGRLINQNEITGDNANDYRDSINMCLDELSTYLDIDYKIKADHTVTIFAEGNALLVNGVTSTLGLRYCAPNENLVEVVFTNSEEILRYDDLDAKLLFRYDRDISAARGNDGGALKGLLAARGTRPVSYADSLENVKARYEQALKDYEDANYTNGTVNGNSIAEKYNMTGERYLRMLELQYQRDTFSVNNCIIPKAQLQLDTLVHGIVTLINNTFSPRDENGNVVIDDDFPYGQDGNHGFMEIFVRKGYAYKYEADPADESLGYIAPEVTSGYDNFLGYDYYSLYTIGNFTINPELRNASSYKKLALSQSGDESDNRLLLGILKDWGSSLIAVDNDTPMSVDLFYRKIISDTSIAANECKKMCESETQTIQQADSERMKTSAVSLDEEMTGMLKYQHAYNAAARLLNYVDSMIDKIINGTGRVGL